MKRIRTLVMLAMLAGAMFLPGASLSVSAQDFQLCTGAQENGEGPYAGYTVVYGTGGSGNQIVLGSTEGGSVLSGGSGDDVLCAWGSGNVLDGGSGNDMLVAVNGEGNVLRGGSGNDTLMGATNNTFEGGSGRNETITWELLPEPRLEVTIGSVVASNGTFCAVHVTLFDFEGITKHTVISQVFDASGSGGALHSGGVEFTTNISGYAEGINIYWQLPETGTVSVTLDNLPYGQFSFENCLELPSFD